MIISFSGIDSSGKTTQISLLTSYFQNQGTNVRTVWGKARGTPGVLFIKDLVRGDKNKNFEEKIAYRNLIYQSPVKRKLLLIASILDLWWYFGIYYRLLHLKHAVLICDRYVWDTYVEIKTEFSSISIDRWIIWKIAVILFPRPDISFFLNLPANESLKRDVKKHENTLSIDTLSRKKNKINLYLNLIENNKWTNIIDGLKPIDAIHRSILEALKQ